MDLTPQLAVSSWSLHRTLGRTWPNRPDNDVTPPAEPSWGEGSITLLEFPAVVATLGIDRVEICSFHIESRDAAYLAKLKAALASSGVTLQTLLIEYGDPSDSATADRDVAWMERWIDAAAELGAEKARVIAGKAKPSPEALDRSAAGLKQLGTYGAARGVEVVTENWFDLLATPQDVDGLFARLDGTVKLNGDFGNWDGPGKYEALRAIFPRAVCCHAKGDFSSGALDTEDYAACLEAATEAGFHGPYTLIYDGPDDDELTHIAIERDFIRDYFSA
ncbi:TIM barrel protein [Mesorhizobium sp. BR1-1-16]|uniref:sugar phosphate isomerase/epimerase family protein n=1 Tax=Mesorhizobium sp. BR1-1-16 TaxID=2876653 RepID=UPI001CCBF5E5|nr:TIM barrel protein [Mesorhizobium sp. BR1-1-16]MBZ9935869.1 TIM barrel protein [Mesorhizobium sp. BR1-1-16]